MGSALLGGGGAGGGSASFFPFGGGCAAQGSNTNLAVPVRIPGTFTILSISVNVSGTNKTCTLQTNKTDTAQTLAPPNVAGTYYNSSNPIHVSGTDTFNGHYTNMGTTLVFWIAEVFVADSGHAGWYCSAQQNVSTSPLFMSPLGPAGGVNATEANTQVRMRTSGILQNMSLSVLTNASSAAYTYVLRKNGVNGNSTITVSSGTGFFEDTTHTDTFASGDLITASVTGANAGSNNVLGCWLSYNGPVNEVFAGQLNTSTSFSASDQFAVVIGEELGGGEVQFGLQHGFAVTASNARWNLISNSMTGTLTIKTRLNFRDGNQTLSIGAGATGWFEDTVNTDSFAATDTINWVIRGGTSGSFVAGAQVLTETPIPPSISTVSYNMM